MKWMSGGAKRQCDRALGAPADGVDQRGRRVHRERVREEVAHQRACAADNTQNLPPTALPLSI